MERIGLLFVIALRNLRSHRLKTFVVASIVALGAFIMVFGLAFLDSIEKAMRRSVTSSFTGHVQVWSDENDAEFQLINLGSEQPDIGELSDFGKVEAQLSKIDGVDEVVPMATGFAVSYDDNQIDELLGELRRALEAGDAAKVDDTTQRIRLTAGILADSFERELSVSSSEQTVREKLEVARRVAADAFWAGLAEDRLDTLQYLDTEFAPLAPTGNPLYLQYLATDPGHFAEVFDRFRVVEGEMIPEGRRGLMIAKDSYERVIKNSVAREFDRLRERFEKGERFTGNPLMQSRVTWLQSQTPKLVLQLDRAETAELVGRLQELVGSKQTDIRALMTQFLSLDDATFAARDEAFEELIAPRIELYSIRPGDVIVLQSFTDNGYMKSVAVTFWGTFEFQGLEGSSIAHGYDILDLVTFRDLYGKMSSAQLAELEQIRESVGVESIARGSVEDELFGGGAEEAVEPRSQVDVAIEIPEQLGVRQAFDDHAYSRDEIRNGLALNVAVMLDDVEAIDRVIEEIDALDGLQATGWKTAAGIVGQFVYVITGVLYFVNLVVFLLAMLIINNSLMMAMMERVKEIGTIRALGGQRDEVLWMVLFESIVLSVTGGLVGAAFAVGLVSWLGAVGIPAPTSIVVFLFGGDRLHPAVGVTHVVAGVAGVTLVTVLSSLYPARIATRVPPIVAMRGD